MGSASIDDSAIVATSDRCNYSDSSRTSSRVCRWLLCSPSARVSNIRQWRCSPRSPQTSTLIVIPETAQSLRSTRARTVQSLGDDTDQTFIEHFPEEHRSNTLLLRQLRGHGPAMFMSSGFVQLHKEQGRRKGSSDVRFGSLADICTAIGHVRFTPNSDRESGFPHCLLYPRKRTCAVQLGMSAKCQ